MRYGEDCAIARSAIIHPKAIVGRGVVVRGDAWIAADAQLGNYSDIGYGAVVESGAVVRPGQVVPAMARVDEDGSIYPPIDEAIPYLPADYRPRHAAADSRPGPDHTVGDQDLAGAHHAQVTA